MSVKTKANLKTSIAGDIANNNAGLITAEDVRSNMTDIVDSINDIVASGLTATTYPFYNNVKIKYDGAGTGSLIVESGVTFKDGSEQFVAYPGPGGIEHNLLDNLGLSDDHPQYIPINGGRKMSGNFGLDTFFINSSGATETHVTKGLGFNRNDDGVEEIRVSGVFQFEDKSRMDTAVSTARAWATFDASGPSVAWSGYNVDLIAEDGEKFEITFSSGVLENNDYLAFGYSNARNTAIETEDFDRNHVGLSKRQGSDSRTMGFAVMTESGVYMSSAKHNHLVVFGVGSGVVHSNINTNS